MKVSCVYEAAWMVVSILMMTPAMRKTRNDRTAPSTKPELDGFNTWRANVKKDKSQFGKLFLRSARRSQLVPLSHKRSSPLLSKR